LLTPQIKAEIKQHALEAYPKESVGVITPHGYKRLLNTSQSPTCEVRVPFKQVSEMIVRRQALAVVHSHPEPAHNAPTAVDMSSQMSCNVPFGIVWTNGQTAAEPFLWGDQMKRQPLVGRPFQHGVTDCYALIRDYCWLEHGVYLNDYARAWEWWRRDDDLYERNFAREHWREIPLEEIRQGDAIFFHIRWSKNDQARAINHAGIYLDGGVLLHHVASRSAFDPYALSRREPLGRWRNRAVKAVRYVEKDLSARST